MKIRIGSRKSELALIQTNTIMNQLKLLHPSIEFELVTMATTGDKVLDRALSKIGEKSLFTKELEIALEQREVDLVVHSLKDLPTTLPEGMTIGAIYKRDSPYDAVILNANHVGKNLSQLPDGSVLGTSSLRRIAQLRRSYPNLVFKDVRGNLNTRLRKLDEDNIYDGLILAEAGIERMGWKHRVSEILNTNTVLYAVGQGAMAVECRANDENVLKIVKQLEDSTTAVRCKAERAFMRYLEGGCSVPLGVHSCLNLETNVLQLDGGVFSLDGKECVKATISLAISSPFNIEDAEAVGVALGRKLEEMGATSILLSARQSNTSSTPLLLAPMQRHLDEAQQQSQQ